MEDSPKKIDRLFVPLTSECFMDFWERGKRYEVRAYSNRFSDSTIYEGRLVELRKGYSGENLWGRIGNVYKGGTAELEDIFSQIGLSQVEPRAASLEEAVRENITLLGDKDRYIVFQVLLQMAPAQNSNL